MSRQIFVNLPVADLARTTSFFTALGFEFDPRFTDEDATSMAAGDGISILFLTRPSFESFTDVAVSDATKATEVIVALSAKSRDEVDDLVAKAQALGATTVRDPDDLSYLYSHGFRDLDGHIWEFVWMDPQTGP
jgi:predicted lactoylglutathione lyase